MIYLFYLFAFLNKQYSKKLEFYDVMKHDDNIYFIALGLRIKRLREDKGMDQKSFAFDCDIARTQLHHIEKGEVNMGLVTIKKIAFELEVSVNEILKDL